ncbi:MAG TPA: hypothetical protein VGS21_08725 [Acidimicrobiales bacterium]|nr:hypothetical protein [Acidimicrobiales bacterium]
MPADAPSVPPPPQAVIGNRLLAAARESLGAALPSYLAARALVLGALALARYMITYLHVTDDGIVSRVHSGLLGWDAAFYRDIAIHGYGALPPGSLRFFPLTPIAARVIAGIPGVGGGAALLIFTNAAALVAAALTYRLVLNETGDEPTARRATFLVNMAPPAFVMVMGYAEPLLLVATAWAFISLRSRSWRSAALAGVVAGLTRPVGVLLAVPACIEALRAWRGCSAAERADRVAAVLGPVAGFTAYLGWTQITKGGFLEPLREQLTSEQRGGLADPFVTFFRDARNLVDGTHIGSGLHATWVLAFLALLVVAFRVLPASYGAYGAVTLLVAFSSSNLDSLERYGFSALVFVVAVAVVARRERAFWIVAAVSAAGLVGYSLLAFMNAYVP